MLARERVHIQILKVHSYFRSIKIISQTQTTFLKNGLLNIDSCMIPG